MMKTMDQHRAKYAWQCVQNAKGNAPHTPEDYLSLARSFPALVLTNGLGQALAFLLSKDTDSHRKLARHLADWLCGNQGAPGLPIYIGGANPGGSVLMRELFNGNSETLRRATTETLSICNWLKRFAEAEKAP